MFLSVSDIGTSIIKASLLLLIKVTGASPQTEPVILLVESQERDFMVSSKFKFNGSKNN